MKHIHIYFEDISKENHSRDYGWSELLRETNQPFKIIKQERGWTYYEVKYLRGFQYTAENPNMPSGYSSLPLRSSLSSIERMVREIEEKFGGRKR